MSTENQDQFMDDALLGAYLVGTVNDEITVKAEDLELGGGGIDYKSIFFEPQPGKSYQIKLVQNGQEKSFVHRSIYKNLPDPERKGKTFNYVSSGIAATCKPLTLFFELNKLKKTGDVLAEKKIEEYLGNTNQACTIIQIVTSNDDDYKPGMFRLMVVSTYGPNAVLANLINQKTNPSKEDIDAGFEKEDVWNIFDSPILVVNCSESVLPGGRKGRDFAKSAWSPVKRIGVTVPMSDEEGAEMFTFKKEHLTATGLASEAVPAFKRLIEIMKQPNLSIHNNFAFKLPGDPKNTEETNKYLISVNEKVDKIIPVIENAKSIAEIQNFCKVDTSTPAESTEKTNQSENILASSIPAELAGSIMDGADVNVETPNTQQANISNETIEGASSEAMSMLEGM